MNTEHRQALIDLARTNLPTDDTTHDFLHTYRVLQLAERIAEGEGGDIDIIVAAALFHDVIVHPKFGSKSSDSQEDSAQEAARLLGGLEWYPQEKIPVVQEVIRRCSFTHFVAKDTLEQGIVHDADLLESSGAVAIARTFAYAGITNHAFYNPEDPEAKNRPFDSSKYALDLFGSRLMIVREKMHTETGRKMLERREVLVKAFYDEFLIEIEGR